ncbi:helix-turn-helix domain-containing protein [Xanthocytophaga agilis]|uniref:Helix-turn-helix domain-containing protein n=1 Tax=Xanthocytophaga agilis TaxID=3048010 RepID=A0AAE3RCQ0_9BACT|nr:helix-turn-helix domain-containing protein [Xanthocytophaga agilis]MDJ1506004.1 helix-turn-helix domain-containing protein [Xanthocytophaga agilis]
MITKETKTLQDGTQNQSPVRHFNVYSIERSKGKTIPYSRRDFYKVTLLTNHCILHYANRSIEITQPALIFSNPLVPYAFEHLSEVREGYFCIFTEEFLKSGDRMDNVHDVPMFKIGGTPVFFLNDKQVLYVESLFQRMLEEIETEYVYKYDLLRNHVNLLIHEALKMQPEISAFIHQNAASRIASLFLELLERQFPIDSPGQVLKLRNASDYAVNLSVHVNHLNYAVREITGKPTTVHITNRIVNEAKALLLHTDWSISEIAYSLGFQYPTYFNNFFKKKTGATPLSLRK